MVDHLTKGQRSRLMSRIRSSGSRPERVLRALVREVSRRRIQLNVRSLPGSPDVVVRPLLLVVMMDGCYWHCCPVHGKIPKSNVAFWTAKIARNVARDVRVDAELRALGWTVWRIWEHDLRLSALPRTRRNLRRRMARLVSSSRSGLSR